MAKNKSTSAEFDAAKKAIDAQFPDGTFVAVECGVPIADAESHRKLVEKLHDQGKNAKGMLIFQAGIDYPHSAVIFLSPFANA